jgi:hypothetical protein
MVFTTFVQTSSVNSPPLKPIPGSLQRTAYREAAEGRLRAGTSARSGETKPLQTKTAATGRH